MLVKSPLTPLQPQRNLDDLRTQLRLERKKKKTKQKPPKRRKQKIKDTQPTNAFDRLLADANRKPRKRKQKLQSKPKIVRGSAYYSSSLWCNTIRPRILKRDNHQCRVCCKCDNLQVHHRSYGDAVMRGNADGQLITLCNDCHILIEFVVWDEKDPTRNKKRHSIKRKDQILEKMLKNKTSRQVTPHYRDAQNDKL